MFHSIGVSRKGNSMHFYYIANKPCFYIHHRIHRPVSWLLSKLYLIFYVKISNKSGLLRDENSRKFNKLVYLSDIVLLAKFCVEHEKNIDNNFSGFYFSDSIFIPN